MPLLSSTQLHSNFELNSKLPNFTRDSFQTLDDMRDVSSLYIDEGHISYCEETGKHYIFKSQKTQTTTGEDGSPVITTQPLNGSERWEELTQQIVTQLIWDDNTSNPLTDELAKSLLPGSLVLVSSSKGDVLYFRTNLQYIEHPAGTQAPDTSGYFCQLPKFDEVDRNYLSKDEASSLYLTHTSAESTYLTKNDAKDTYQTIDDTDANFLKKNDASDLYVLKSVAEQSYQKQEDAQNTYLSKNDASSTYLSKNDASSTYLSQREADEEYAKKDDIRLLVDGYQAGQPDSYVGVDIVEGLRGEKGIDISSRQYSINEIIDKILFKEWVPEHTQPSIEIDFKLSEWDKNKTWYDPQNKVLLLKINSNAPQQHFIGMNIQNSQFVALNGTTFNHTNGINTNEQHAQNSKIICKTKGSNGWSQLPNLPSTFNSPGDYRYYFDARFKAGEPVLNNKGEVKVRWNANTPIESKNFITINVSKPTKKNTSSGFVDNPIVYWTDDTIVDYFTLSATGVVEQKFQTPREAKKIYVWNDLCGYAENSSFSKTKNNDGYYEYTYDHTNKGHRGEIKIKVEF